MRLVVDIESTGLDIYTDEVLCVVAQDFDTGEIYEFRPGELQNVGRLLESADKVIMHNGIAFDAAMLWEQGWAAIPFGKIVDTLVLSRLYYPDREGGHSLENWGKKLGFPKIEFDDFSQFSEDMLTYCKRDVELTVEVYKALLREKGDHDWDLSERIEHRVQQILFEQEENGWKFRVEDAKKLVEWLESEMENLESKMDFGMYYEKRGQCNKPFKKDGSISEAGKWCEGVAGPFGKIEWHPIRLSQREKVAQSLQRMGWVPTSWTKPTEKHPNGQPQLTPNKEPCPNLIKMGEIGKDIAYYSLCAHRKGQIEGWVENCRDDGRLPSVAIGNSTNTGRMAHRIIANVPKASESVFLGPEIRDLFTHEEGYTLVGWDAEGLELRVLAHYMNDPDFTKAVVEGKKEDKTDIHNLMLSATNGLIPDRDTTKNCVYAIVYSAGDWKLGQTAGYTKNAKAKGAEIRNAWAKRFPKLPQLVEQVTKAAERGYLKAIDGRKVWMRRDPTGKVMAHKGLNTLIQATGSIIVKTADCYLTHYVKSANLDARQLIVYHDEVVAEVAPKDLDKYVELCYTSMNKTERLYDFHCPLSIEVKSGSSWREVH